MLILQYRLQMDQKLPARHERNSSHAQVSHHNHKIPTDLPRFSSKPKIDNNKLLPKNKPILPVPIDRRIIRDYAEDTQVKQYRSRQSLSKIVDLQLNRIRKSQNLSVKTKSSCGAEISKIRKSIQLKSRYQDQLEAINRKNILVDINKNSLLKLKSKSNDEPNWNIDRMYINKGVVRRRQKIHTEAIKEQKNSSEPKMNTETNESNTKKHSKYMERNELKRSRNASEYEQEKVDNQEKLIDIKSEIAQIDIGFFVRIQNILISIQKAIRSKDSIYDWAYAYIVEEKSKNQKLVYSLLKNSKQVTILRNMFIYSRLTVFYVMHCEINKRKQKLTAMGETVLQITNNFTVVIELIMDILTNHKKLDLQKLDNREKKIRQIIKINLYIKNLLLEVFSRKGDPVVELLRNLLESALKINSLEFANIIEKTLKWQILKMPSYPFLPASSKQHTLILDLDETLVHFDQKQSLFYVRPYTQQFLKNLAKYFEIVVFTAGTKEYADQIIDQIDPQHHVSYRLYRNHLTEDNGLPVKDINKLGREPHKSIIVDNITANFRLQPENGILISSWYGEEDDSVLEKLETVLKDIVKRYGNNVKEGIKDWQEFIEDEISVNRIIYEMRQEL